MEGKFRGKIGKKGFLTIVGIIGLALLMSACTNKQVTITQPTCREALADRYHELTDYEIAGVLDDNLDDDCYGCLENCWIPLMQKALGESRAIPHRHLLKAVKVFNQQRYVKYFHIAVYRYFSDLSQGQGHYRDVDRELMRTYCSMLVRDSFTQQDKKLSQTMELCRRLDPVLYGKMFR